MVSDADPAWLVVGHLRRPHGTGGELQVESLTDHPEATFAPGIRLRVSGPDGREPDELFPPIEVESTRAHGDELLVRFRGIDDRDRAGLIRGRYLLRALEEVPPLGEDEIFHHQLVGLTVVTRAGKEVGTVREVYDQGPTELLAVTTPTSEVLIPFTRQVVAGWDLERSRLVVDPPDGLLDL